ncbi:hypothetical protein EGW08_007583 [Elysia chlorotica]|uniref:Uncharacterized protein n=1 Tax=Elysia chlorotica TaxID=188477 RepID=A0A433TSS1_ELYCH|nr:hypothetical protein EGW08_007583 [Elysia chlorotica]
MIIMGATEILVLWFFILTTLCLKVEGSRCSWSNENCREHSDCCSNSCHKAHEGTNPRCRHSTLGEPCVFDYHCQDSLECGTYYNCCSPYWKICINDNDCCDPQHVCRSAEDFDYDRCLFPSAASRPSLWLSPLLLLLPFISCALAQCTAPSLTGYSRLHKAGTVVLGFSAVIFVGMCGIIIISGDISRSGVR